jgi:hypothetical protein
MLDRMVALARAGSDIICASRHAGQRHGRLPTAQAVLVRSANFTLRHLARLPTTDASNGFHILAA